MAKQVTENKERISGLELVRFQSNGKHKNMPKDEVYEVSADIAQILIDKKLGNVID